VRGVSAAGEGLARGRQDLRLHDPHQGKRPARANTACHPCIRVADNVRNIDLSRLLSVGTSVPVHILISASMLFLQCQASAAVQFSVVLSSRLFTSFMSHRHVTLQLLSSETTMRLPECLIDPPTLPALSQNNIHFVNVYSCLLLFDIERHLRFCLSKSKMPWMETMPLH
jgi:hypothetical protein